MGHAVERPDNMVGLVSRLGRLRVILEGVSVANAMLAHQEQLLLPGPPPSSNPWSTVMTPTPKWALPLGDDLVTLSLFGVLGSIIRRIATYV